VDWVWSVVGAVVVAVVLRDVFHTLFHPAGEGSLSRAVLAAVWRAFHWRAGHSRLSLAGPVGFVAVVAAWAVLLVLGFAIVYWPRLGGSFTFVSNLEPSANSGFFDTVYFSAVTLATLGYGDVAAAATAARLVAVFEGIVGLALLTAAVSWLLSIYAALQRRRALAGTVAAIAEGGTPSDQLLESLAVAVQSVRANIIQHTAAYYFHSREASLLLPVALPALRLLADSGSDAALTLRASLDSLARTLAGSVEVDSDDFDAVAAAYADDHRVSGEAAALAARLEHSRRRPGLP
jgi:voltage-gated potassium channel Kch